MPRKTRYLFFTMFTFSLLSFGQVDSSHIRFYRFNASVNKTHFLNELTNYGGQYGFDVGTDFLLKDPHIGTGLKYLIGSFGFEYNYINWSRTHVPTGNNNEQLIDMDYNLQLLGAGFSGDYLLGKKRNTIVGITTNLLVRLSARKNGTLVTTVNDIEQQTPYSSGFEYDALVFSSTFHVGQRFPIRNHAVYTGIEYSLFGMAYENVNQRLHPENVRLRLSFYW
ncbi:MAG: hypothetical protein V4604_08840 [Bacteroidota bacterium]